MAETLEDELKNLSPDELKKARKKVLELLEKENLTAEIKENLRNLLGAKKPFLGDMDSFTAMMLGMLFATVVFSIIRKLRFYPSLGVDSLINICEQHVTLYTSFSYPYPTKLGRYNMFFIML
jgi:hypothetical protein